MSDGWAMKSIGELCEAPKLRKAEVGTVPYIEIGDVDVVSKLVNLKDKPAVKGSVLAPANSLLVSRVRPTRGAITLLKGTQAVSSAFLALQPKAGTNLRLLFYWLAYSVDFRAHVEGAQIGSLYPSVREEDILKYRLNYPSDPAEQQRIVRLLDEAFEGIAIAKTNAAKNLQNARALFESVLEAIFTQPRAGWKITSLADSCEMYQPKTISKSELSGDGAYPVYGANGVIGRYNQFNHEEPQLLITCRGATCGAVNVSQPYSWITGNAMVVRPKIESLDVRYLEYVFRGGIDLSNAITGTAQPQITRSSLSPLMFSYPTSPNEQLNIVAKLDGLTQHVEELEILFARKGDALKELTQTILHQAFNGSLKAA